jgi:SAM-dependent methyltransferase
VYTRLRYWLEARPFIQQKRKQRCELFASLCLKSGRDTILDVGCGSGTLVERHNTENPITALDLLPENGQFFRGQENVRFVAADAAAMPFPDGSFDVAFSNSVIEHLPVGRRSAYAREVRRVARRYFVQTPNKHFPVEPHLWIPFAQYLPQRVRQQLERRLLDGEQIHLLTAPELESLFPDAEIVRERFLGVTKSLIAVRHY